MNFYNDSKINLKEVGIIENPYLPIVINKQPDAESTERSEEVQSIIERMPTQWAKWVALCVGVLMGVILLLGFLIQYPDTVDGQVSVTAVTAPVRLVANSNGRITLLQPNNALLQKGDVIATLVFFGNHFSVSVDHIPGNLFFGFIPKG